MTVISLIPRAPVITDLGITWDEGLRNSCAKPLPEDLGDEILHFYPHPPT